MFVAHGIYISTVVTRGTCFRGVEEEEQDIDKRKE